jgi:hypothetical protein
VADARHPVQRVKGDAHEGVYVQRQSDGQYMIKVEVNFRPKWFIPPSGHGLTVGQKVSFTEGDDGAVTLMTAQAAPKAYRLPSGDDISDAEIDQGTVRPIHGRTNGDVELVASAGGKRVTVHIHPYAGSGSTPTGGGISVDGQVYGDNAPGDIVERIAKHAGFAAAVEKAKPPSTADASDNWRNPET